MAEQTKEFPGPQLSDEAKKRMKDWWDKWDEKPKCPICQERNWDLPGHVIVMHLSVDDLHTVIGGPISPFFPVHCMACGYAMFVNALVAGVVRPRKEGE